MAAARAVLVQLLGAYFRLARDMLLVAHCLALHGTLEVQCDSCTVLPWPKCLCALLCFNSAVRAFAAANTCSGPGDVCCA